MSMPTHIKAVCYANGHPLEGAIVKVTIKVAHKNDFTVPFGPTGPHGIATITLTEIERWVDAERAIFPADYTGLGDFTGELVVAVESREALGRALDAYVLLHSFYPYPLGYADKLRGAIDALNRVAPAILHAQVEHDGEGVQVRTPETAA